MVTVKLLSMSQSPQENLKQQTQVDPVLQQLKGVILKGWPNEMLMNEMYMNVTLQTISFYITQGVL